MSKITHYTIQLHQLAVMFRTNDELNAIKEMQDLLQEVASDREILIKCDINAISNIMILITGCQERDDWLGLADYLDYDLPKIINSRP